ncbi:acyltransferase [Mesorhizobium sp. WSM4976]|uniref:acyltransferase family protein n=1 Tax=Mesorhizobium sp. WSM4976 TaxID=3038549 RepID=UPI002415F113|nr:acyltransferase [Mesorhizobium sp. WSM4976]MDG4894614.1 acyltransferase [Mesorhizobium sp. WSM4976]
MHQERVAFANTLRGVAAISVLIAHYTGAFWSSNREFTAAMINAPVLPLDRYGFPTYLLWLHSVPHFDWGSFGVGVFFLVSGFVIPLSLRRSTWQAFLVGRFFRIVPLYVCGFSVTLLGIWLVGEYFGRPWPFTLGDVLVQYIPGPQLFLWVRSIDGIVWTLEIELIFYVVCALAIIWLRKRSALAFLVPLIVAAIGLYVSGTVDDWKEGAIATYHLLLAIQWAAPFIVFMFIGVTFCYLHSAGLDRLQAIVLTAGLFMLFTVMAGEAKGIAGGGGLAFSYGLAVAVFAVAAMFPSMFRSTVVGDFFAKISYPLYVVHGVAGYAALRVLLDLGLKAWMSLIIVTAGAMGVAWLLHVSVEVPSHVLGKRMAAYFPRRGGNAAPSAVSAPTPTI